MDEIIIACQREADAAQRPDPEAEKRLRHEAGEGQARQSTSTAETRARPRKNKRQTERLLKQLRGERAAIEAELSAIEAAKNRVITPPTAEQVRAMLTDLRDGVHPRRPTAERTPNWARPDGSSNC